jgi:hypothetical protein
VSALAQRILLDKGQSYLRLSGANPIGIDDTVVAFEDGTRPLIAVPLKRREYYVRVSGRRWCRCVEKLVAVKFEQCA